jgi:predicted N-acetyltransferase YhbS
VETNVDQQPATWQVEEIQSPDDAVLDAAAAVTRGAFAADDLLPALPAADGSAESAASLRDDLRSGGRLFIAHAGDGRPEGCVRAIPLAGSAWQVRRLAVSTEARGRGLGRALMRRLEAAARAEGLRRVLACAVVERGVPPFYSRLGYRTTSHFASPGKLLSEVVMELDLCGRRQAHGYPWGTEPHGPGQGTLVSWFGSERCSVAVIGRLAADARAVVARHGAQAAGLAGQVPFIGGDGWLGAPPGSETALRDRLACRADSQSGPVLLFRRPCVTVTEFTMPRAIEPGLLALWRMPLRAGLRR